MKQNKFITLILSLLLMAGCIMGAAAAGSSDSASRFGVLIDNNFSEKSEFSSTDYRDIHYTLQSVDTGLYAKAFYDSSNRCYVIEEWVELEEDSTTFTAAMDTTDPGRLAIAGIPSGSYAIENIQGPAGSQLLHEPILLEFLTDYAEDGTAKYNGILNGSELPFAAEDGMDSIMLPFAVTFTPGYNLRDLFNPNPVDSVIRAGLFILAGFCIMSLVIKGKKKSEASQRE